MTAFDLAMAGYLAFGQPTGNYYEAITKHAGLQAIHPDGAVTLRLAEVGREELAAAQLKQIRYNGVKVSLNSEGYLSGPKGLIISFY